MFSLPDLYLYLLHSPVRCFNLRTAFCKRFDWVTDRVVYPSVDDKQQK